MHVIYIYYKGRPTKTFVTEINYAKSIWSSGNKPKIFGTLESANKCVKQISKLAPAMTFKIYKLEEVM